MRGLRTRLRLRDERGVTAIIVAASAVALFGMVALTVDVGFLMIQRRVVVRSVDSGVLAAAQSYAIGEDGAFPAVNDAPAVAQANALAAANEPDVTLPADEYRASFPCEDADLVASLRFPENVGCVTAAYSALQSLFFAPVIGIDRQSEVGWRASAIWGPAGSATPAPMVLDSSVFFPCYTEGDEPEVGTTCAFWFNNESVTAETWGFLNLDQWDVASDASCTSASNARVQEWIRGINVPTLSLRDPPPVFVCRHPGVAAFNPPDGALSQQVGLIKIFPISDPNQEVLGPHRKYAIIGFTALRIDAILQGGAAYGTSGNCSHTTDLNPGDTIDIDMIPGNGCPNGVTQDRHPPDAEVAEAEDQPTLRPQSPGNAPPFEVGVDYQYDETTRVITWNRPFERNVRIRFDWAAAGACGIRDADANARCLILSWAGPQVGGSNPGDGPAVPGGLQAVRLAE
jgi:hypothetical protein